MKKKYKGKRYQLLDVYTSSYGTHTTLIRDYRFKWVAVFMHNSLNLVISSRGGQSSIWLKDMKTGLSERLSIR